MDEVDGLGLASVECVLSQSPLEYCLALSPLSNHRQSWQFELIKQRRHVNLTWYWLAGWSVAELSAK